MELKKIEPIELRAAGLDASSRGTTRIVFGVSDKTIDETLGPITNVLKEAEAVSR